MRNESININYDLPQGFYQLIEPYIRERNSQVITEPIQLFKLWYAALKYYKQYKDYPEIPEAIAEWTMVATSSPLTNDNDYYDAIQTSFGELEVLGKYNDEGWRRLESLVKEAANAKSIKVPEY